MDGVATTAMRPRGSAYPAVVNSKGGARARAEMRGRCTGGGRVYRVWLKDLRRQFRAAPE